MRHEHWQASYNAATMKHRRGKGKISIACENVHGREFLNNEALFSDLQLQLPQSVHRLYTDCVSCLRMSVEMTEGRLSCSRPYILFEARYGRNEQKLRNLWIWQGDNFLLVSIELQNRGLKK